MIIEQAMLWIVPSLALLISAASFGVSLLAYRRAGAAEKPIVWIDLVRTSDPQWFLATLHLKNRSAAVLAGKSISLVSIKKEFLLGDYTETSTISPSGERGLASGFVVPATYMLMPLRFTVQPQTTTAAYFLLFKASFSSAAQVAVIFTMEAREAKPRTMTAKPIARF